MTEPKQTPSQEHAPEIVEAARLVQDARLQGFTFTQRAGKLEGKRETRAWVDTIMILSTDRATGMRRINPGLGAAHGLVLRDIEGTAAQVIPQVLDWPMATNRGSHHDG